MNYAKQIWLMEQHRPAVGERCFVVWSEVENLNFAPGFQVWSLWRGLKTYWLSAWNQDLVNARRIFLMIEDQGPMHKGDFKWKSKVPVMELSAEEELAFAILDGDPSAADLVRDVMERGS